MNIYRNQRAGGATTCEAPLTQTIALSGVFAAGALLLSVSSMIGALGTLASLLTLTGAFAVGYAIARWQLWPARFSLALMCYALLLSMVGWLLMLIAWNGFHYWLAMLPGIVVSALALGFVWRKSKIERGLPGRAVKNAIAASTIGVTMAVLVTAYCAGPGGSGFAYALAVLADLALLGALVVRIREQDLE
ncbi:hypothetical protein B9037_012885 [Klebsiella aerogenes]|uniref:hypothetical protein n=1 Tax=Klebsiella aerogenes TaxID=548 RepID=UPI000B40B86A|nr:hypothetical protein [Klebsiella aerogenes]MEB7637472.1 hypothetical protein [Klebsiella aerogenes]RNT29519.1 hypothetical protein B9037_012885 [Klebsiella aerogenes]HDS4950409.1 hypothetical protein [Klebsiella aerogenes]